MPVKNLIKRPIAHFEYEGRKIPITKNMLSKFDDNARKWLIKVFRAKTPNAKEEAIFRIASLRGFTVEEMKAHIEYHLKHAKEFAILEANLEKRQIKNSTKNNGISSSQKPIAKIKVLKKPLTLKQRRENLRLRRLAVLVISGRSLKDVSKSSGVSEKKLAAEIKKLKK